VAARRRAPVRLSSPARLEALLAPHGLQPLAPVERRRFSLVFAARQAGTGRELFVKLLTSRAAGVRRNFGREVEILRGLAGDPGVAALHAASLDDQLTFHACAYVRGPSLVEIARRPGNLATVLAHTRDLAHWIVHLHRRGIAHRDLSPDHVFVEPSGRLIVLDFGMAKRTHTLPAAERRLCEGYDVQALGMILWEMICGKAIFPYREHSLPGVLRREITLIEDSGLPSAVRFGLIGCLAAASEFTPAGLPSHRGYGGAAEAVSAFSCDRSCSDRRP
jgi:serine/threonine protein kinase